MNYPPEVTKYLKKFGTGNWQLFKEEKQRFKLILVIPVISEFENVKELINSFENNDSKYFNETLVLFVINNRKSVEQKIKDDNLHLINYLSDILNSDSKKLNYNFIDASTDGNELPEKDGGVGLARKIGMDLALKYFDYSIPKKNILLCCDGDCKVAENYFTEVTNNFNSKNISAGYVKYLHPVDNAENQQAIINYEIFLRYYVLGLKYSESPFAIHTIGSTMACDAESYIKIQGMNKRKAAEDFYFMEKLTKITKIEEIRTTEIYPSNRGSWRVPFGTGQRVNRFLSEEQNEYLLYSPESFKVLKKWNELFYYSAIKDVNELLQSAKSINKELHNFLLINKFDSDWPNIISNSKNLQQLKKQKEFWFDGFRTLKLIHYLRDEVFPQKDMFEAVDELLTEMGIDIPSRQEKIPSIKTQLEYLKILRENT